MNTKKFSPYLIYTLLFPLTAAMVFSFFVYTGKTMMWRIDGVYQHYNAFLYLGSWIRNIIKTLWSEHKLIIPLFEWGLGYGSDVITTLSYYTFGDPFALISVITPSKYGEIGYILSILLRFYAAGLAFTAYAKRMNCANWSTVCATLIYVFCTYSITVGVRHPYFLSPMIYFPLVLLGCEKIFERESPLPFTLSVFLSAFSNFYFFYMIVILTIFYVGIRLLSEKQYRNIKSLCFYLLRFSGYAILGCALAGVLLLPNIMNILGNSRINGTYSFNAFYSLRQYRALWGTAVGVKAATPYSLIGMAPLAYLGLGSILMQKKEHLWTKLYFLLEILFLIFPAAGYVLNGFGYVTNRWVFAWSFLIAYMFAKGFPYLFHITIRQKFFLSTGCILYFLGCICLTESRKKECLFGCVLLLLALIFVICNDRFPGIKTARIRFSKEQHRQIITLCLTILCIFDLAYFLIPSKEGNYISDFQDIGSGNDLLINDRAAVWKLIDDSEFYRIDNSLTDNKQRNYLISSGQSTTSTYWSLQNPCLVDFMHNTSAYRNSSYSFHDLDSRSYLLPLVSAKYFVTRSGKAGKASVPYGYSFVGKKKGYGGTYLLYQSNTSLPFGYTYQKTVSMDDFKNMSLVQRQQTMLQGAVLENSDAASLPLQETAPVYNDKTIPYNLECGNHVTYDGKTFYVDKKGGSVTLSFSSPGAGELYLQAQGVNYQKSGSDDFSKTWDDIDNFSTRTSMIVKCKPVTIQYNIYTNKNRYSENRSNYLMNLGYSEKDRTTITLKFRKAGSYTIDSLSILCQPMDGLAEQVNHLKEDILENVVMETNHITGTISLEQPKLLCLSLPYSKGWRIFVDGKETELLRTNIMLSGVMLESGSHIIELKYCTPYLTAGLIISLLALLFLISLCCLRKKIGRKNATK